MFRLLLGGLFIIYSAHVPAQETIKQYVKANTVTIQSIDPDSSDYTDLQPIGAAIGNARIVMLGEQDHGDAPTFLAKTRLIKYLHEVKGFTVLAFESDFFALNEGWRNTRKEKPAIDSFLVRTIYPIWTQCVQCENLLYTYLPATQKTPAPLEISGFDNQLISDYSLQKLPAYLNNLLQQKNLSFTATNGYKDDFLPFVDTLLNLHKRTTQFKDYSKQNRKQFRRFTISINTLLHELGGDTASFEVMVLQNLKMYAKEIFTTGTIKTSWEVRDAQMARNLEWLLYSKYSGKKIIVWAANAHIMKNADTLLPIEKLKYRTMGTVFSQNKKNADQTYIIGFTSRQGTAGRINKPTYKVPKPVKDGFESWINKGIKYAFTDFRKYTQYNNGMVRPFYMKGLGLNVQADWSQLFDGVFYIRDMYPCQKIN